MECCRFMSLVSCMMSNKYLAAAVAAAVVLVY